MKANASKIIFQNNKISQKASDVYFFLPLTSTHNTKPFLWGTSLYCLTDRADTLKSFSHSTHKNPYRTSAGRTEWETQHIIYSSDKINSQQCLQVSLLWSFIPNFHRQVSIVYQGHWLFLNTKQIFGVKVNKWHALLYLAKAQKTVWKINTRQEQVSCKNTGCTYSIKSYTVF